MPQRKVLVIAHRGARAEAPENTLAAFDRAIRIGADWIELDVRLTADGRLAVIHDESVKRTTGARGKVARMTMRELKRLDAGARFGGAFAGERIPELAEVVEACDGRAGLVVEVKDPAGREAIISARVRKALAGFRGEAVVESFDKSFLRLYKKTVPGARAALLTESARGLSEARKASADAVSASLRSPATRLLLPRVKRAGLGLFVWTVKSFRALARALAFDVDGVITDYPREVRAVLEELDRAAAYGFSRPGPGTEGYLRWRRMALKEMKRWPLRPLK